VPLPPATVTPLRAFRSAVVVITPGQSAAQADRFLAFVKDVVAAFPAHWLAATEGLATMDIGAPEPIAPEPDDGAMLQAFYATHPDDYDFVARFILIAQGCCSNERRLRSDPKAPARPMLYAADVPAKAQRLLGIANFLVSPATLDFSGGVAFQMPLMLHEFHHQWCCYLKAPASSGLDANAFLTEDGAHWSTFLLFPPRPKYPIVGRNTADGGWTENPDGTFTPDCTPPSSGPPGTFRYPKLGLYLMGLVPATEVPPITVLRDAVIPPPGQACPPIRARKVTVPFAEVVAANPP
jgi:hypothetical protein